MTDIVKRLQRAMDMEPEVHSFEAMREAKTEIERLRKENAEMREALLVHRIAIATTRVAEATEKWLKP